MGFPEYLVLLKKFADLFLRFPQNFAHLRKRIPMPDRHILQPEPLIRIGGRGPSLGGTIGGCHRLNPAISLSGLFELSVGCR